MKGPNSENLYPGGFKLALQPLGSTYLAPTNQTLPVLSWTNGVTTLYGGDMFSGEAAVFTFVKCYLRPPATIIPEPAYENLKVSISKSTGTVSGSFLDTVTGKRTPICGVLLQQQKAGRGFFLGPDSAGAFSLTAATPIQ